MSPTQSSDPDEPKEPRPKRSKPTAVRTDWLDAASDTPLVHEYAQRLGTYLEAMADGVVTDKELKDQEARVVELMKKVEPKLKGAVHEDVTHLLCELSAYNIMHTIHELMSQAPKTKFRG